MLSTIDFEVVVVVLKTLWHSAEGLLAAYGLWAVTYELREKAKDLMGRRKGDEYRIKWTSIKDVIREGHTERIKLRLVRVNQEKQTLTMDKAPVRDPNSTPVDVSSLYSIPGSASIGDGKINIVFAEKLKAFQDHVVLIGYTMNESLEDLHTPPGVFAKQPVGEYLIYEAHFPPRRRYQRATNDAEKPRIVVRTKTRALVEKELAEKEYQVEGDCSDFDDGLGPVDWLRVKIPKPPQDHPIHIDWFWQEEISQPNGK